MRNTMLLCALATSAAVSPLTGQSIDPRPTPVATTAATAVPALVRYNGIDLAETGTSETGKSKIMATFLIFKDEKGGQPIWSETQNVSLDATGHYEVFLGATSASGLPLDLFSNGEARWLEVQIAGQASQPRVLLATVPYAAKAADAATLGGLPASAFALAGSPTTNAQTNAAPDASSSTVTTPGGTAGYLPVYSAATTIDDSILYQSTTKIGIGTSTPASTLDVNGAITGRGPFTLASTGTPTSSIGKPSQPIDFTAGAYNSSTAKTTYPIFALQSEAAGNDTATPAATLNLLYGNGVTPAETGLSISNKGIIKFATGQAFPGVSGGGTITGVTTTSPLTGSGTTGTVALGLNLSALETSLNSKYAQLGAANKFTGLITFATGQTFPGAGTITGVTAGTDLIGGGTTGIVKLSLDTTKIATLTGSPVFNGSAADGVQGETAGTTLNTAGVLGVAGSQSGATTGIAGVWGDAYAHVGVLGTSNEYTGVQGISTNSYGVQGSSASNTAVLGTSTSGTGVSGLSTSNSGVAGYTSGATLNTAGVLGKAGAVTGDQHIIAGVWGDSYQQVGVEGTSIATVGVYGQSQVSAGMEGVSTSGNGVHGVSQSTSGIFGETSSTSGADAAIFGYSHANAVGVYGFSAAANGVHGVSTNTSGILAETSSTSEADAAVYAASHGNASGLYSVSSKFGVHSVSGGASSMGGNGYIFPNGPAAIWADTNGPGYAIAGTADNAVAAEFFNNSPGQSTIYAANYYGNYGDVADFAGNGGSCEFFGNGDVTCTGSIASSNAIEAGARAVTTYSVQSAESWYEDAGSAQLVDGVAHVSLDLTFGQTVNTSIEYHVFLTPGGDSDGLYVTNKTAQGFDVREQHNGHSNISFDYRIMAKRAGHETERLADVTRQMQKEAEKRAANYPSRVHAAAPPAAEQSAAIDRGNSQ